MAVTREQFLVQFPEFSKSNAALVEAMLAAAELEIDRDVWDAKADQGVMYLAAHKLALSPMGNSAELVPAGGVTSYRIHYDALVLQVGSGFRVI